MRALRLFSWFLPVGLCIVFSGCTAENSKEIKIDAGGATFVEPIMKFWTDQYREKTKDQVKINYQGTGSSDGAKRMTSKEFAFGCSDAPLNARETTAAKDNGGAVIHVPLVMGAVVPMYNLDLPKPVVFSGEVLAEIYLGKITKWNDPKLQKLNEGVALPDLDIQAVYRAEGSGTSYIFTEYLSKVHPEFAATVGASKSPNFKNVGIGKKGSDGVSGHISQTPGAIGYIELTYALDTKSSFGAVLNSMGKAIIADLNSITKAAEASLDVPQTLEPYSLHELTYNLTNAPGAESYPIAAMSFCVIYQQQPADRGAAIVEFLKWATSAEGQDLASKRNYAPLPESLQKKIAEKLATVEMMK